MPAQARFRQELTVALSDQQRAWIDAEAARRGLSSAAVVRELIASAMSAAQTATKRGAA